MIMKRLLILLLTMLFVKGLLAQDSWSSIVERRKGKVVINYYDSENFIIKKKGKYEGIEYDLILHLFDFLERRYGVDIEIEFKRASSFGNLYQHIMTGRAGEFGACSFSFTRQRMKEVQFSPSYMPDLEVMVCSEDLPIVEDTNQFVKHFRNATAYVVRNTTFEEDVQRIQYLIPGLKIKYVQTGIEVIEKISHTPNSFGYSELPNYITAFQQGFKVKRQSMFKIERLGHGLIYPQNTDWQDAIETFFKDPGFPGVMNKILKNRLGDDIKDLILELEDNLDNKEVNLLNKELEFQRIELEKRELEAERERIVRNVFIGGVIFALLVVSLLFYINLVRRKTNRELSSQKEEISLQKHIIEQSNKNILDSINYAKLIQDSILPSRDYFNEILPESFVYYSPKDIVSGDFYFIGKPSDPGSENVTVFAVGDCTGHGVPGALLSIIGKTFLQLGLSDQQVNSCAAALNYLNIGLFNILSSRFSTIRDGMDIAMGAIDRKTLMFEFSGGNRAAYIVREGEVITLKPDKFGIGETRNGQLPLFNNHAFQLQKGDTIYLFSDGYGDQFGGPNEKKFKISQMRKMFIEIHELPMEKQSEIVQQRFEEWKGNQEQIDDVCLMGVKV
ncbi:MAG: transporter substrate-binding domain-containing protein [Bacteroidetes bacterium]|nr:MAG: transporter substrate-binding domain-containing protein [Bacteroidota bacterium]